MWKCGHFLYHVHMVKKIVVTWEARNVFTKSLIISLKKLKINKTVPWNTISLAKYIDGIKYCHFVMSVLQKEFQTCDVNWKKRSCSVVSQALSLNCFACLDVTKCSFRNTCDPKWQNRIKSLRRGHLRTPEFSCRIVFFLLRSMRDCLLGSADIVKDQMFENTSYRWL
jgi:hypothetical protein